MGGERGCFAVSSSREFVVVEEVEAGGVDGEENRKQRKPIAIREASTMVIGLVRRILRATAMLAGLTPAVLLERWP